MKTTSQFLWEYMYIVKYIMYMCTVSYIIFVNALDLCDHEIKIILKQTFIVVIQRTICILKTPSQSWFSV